MFSYSGPCGGVTLLQQYRCNAVHGLTSLLHSIACVLSYRLGRAPRPDEPFLQWVPAADNTMHQGLV